MNFPIGKEINLPEELVPIREAARRAISPLKSADGDTKADKQFLFNARRSDAGENLPPYYLVYFLLVDLLGFPNLGQFEKISWSVPVDLDGVAYLIEHRKFGIGVFAREGEEGEKGAKRIVGLIHNGVGAAKPFFKWMAENAVQASKFNVRNIGIKLYRRYVFFRDKFKLTSSETEKLRKDRAENDKQRNFFWGHEYSSRLPKEASWLEHAEIFTFKDFKRAEDASWFAIAAVEAFFGWTEHIFIHLAILQGQVTTGAGVTEMADSDWGTKFKLTFDLNDKVTNTHFEKLITIRRQVRNFMAHGAFGKGGEAFSFHSGAGAVPVALDHKSSKTRFSLTPELAFEDHEAIATIEAFISFMWSGVRAPAKIYIQESELPLILPHASDGKYLTAMASVEAMKEFLDHLSGEWDRARNMDW
jgi:hypothetical protein